MRRTEKTGGVTDVNVQRIGQAGGVNGGDMRFFDEAGGVNGFDMRDIDQADGIGDGDDGLLGIRARSRGWLAVNDEPLCSGGNARADHRLTRLPRECACRKQRPADRRVGLPMNDFISSILAPLRKA